MKKIITTYLSRISFIFAFLGASFTFYGQCPSNNRLYVNPFASSSDNSGISWDNAAKDFEALQVALGKCTSVTEVWVAQGVYSIPISNTELITRNTNTPITFYGGFSSGESTLNQRDWNKNEVIVEGNGSDKSVFAISNSSVTIDGFKIQNFKTTGTKGIFSAKNANVITLKNCIFRNNLSRNGLFQGDAVELYVYNNYFFGNTAEVADKGLFNFNNLSSYCTLAHNTFYGNTSDHLMQITNGNGKIDFNNNLLFNSFDLSNKKSLININTANNVFDAVILNNNAFGGTSQWDVKISNCSEMITANNIPVSSYVDCNTTSNQNYFLADLNFLQEDQKAAILKPESPDGVNKGDAKNLPSDITKDIVGNKRIDGTIDIGAFETSLCSNPLIVTLDTDKNSSGVGECGDLRYAINYANGKNDVNTITFAIPTVKEAPAIINLKSNLPSIIYPLNIAGRSQFGYGADTTKEVTDFQIKVQIDGSSAALDSGITISSSNVEIRGVSIVGFSEYGITTSGSTPTSPYKNIKIEGCYIGLDANKASKPNKYGIYLNYCENSIIGGAYKRDFNTISNNTESALFLNQCNSIAVYKNIIGLSPDATSCMANGRFGIYTDGGSGLRIGSENANLTNVVACNGIGQIYIAKSQKTTITNNLIGFGLSMPTTVPSGKGNGITVYESPDLIIGSSLSSFYNKIANVDNGIYFESNKSAYIEGNSIYSNATQGIRFNGDPAPFAKPIIESVKINSPNVLLSGTVVSPCLLQFYADTKDQGQLYLGSLDVTAADTWTTSFVEATAKSKILAEFQSLSGIYLTATATYTDSGVKQTSAFSVPVKLDFTSPAPTGLCVQAGDKSAKVSWDVVSGVTDYNVLYAKDPKDKSSYTEISSSTNSLTLSLDNDLMVYVAVTYANGDTSAFVPVYPTAKAGNSVKIGANNYAEISNGTKFTTDLSTTGTTSFELWFKPEIGKNMLFFNAGLGSLILGINASGNVFQQSNKTAIGNITWPTNLTDNQWHHLAWVNTGNDANVYLMLDNLAVTNPIGTTITTGFKIDDNTFTIGGGSVLAGEIDELRVWSISRKDVEVSKDINIPLLGNETGLIGLFHFDEPLGTTETSAINSVCGSENALWKLKTAQVSGAMNYAPCSDKLLVTKTTDDGTCGTLRYAITQANLTIVKDIISFQFSGTEPHQIILESELPTITNPLLIDGRSVVSGYIETSDASTFTGHTLAIEINQGTKDLAQAFKIGSNDVTIRSLAIGGFTSGAAISSDGTHSNFVLEGSYIGLHTDGTINPNGTGVSLSSISNSTIGGGSNKDYNVISGNINNGIDYADCTGLTIIRNRIGTSPDAATAVPNKGYGIYSTNSTGSNIGLLGTFTTGGQTFTFTEKDGFTNTIAGNTSGQIFMENSDAKIQNNNIGLKSGESGEGIVLNEKGVNLPLTFINGNKFIGAKEYFITNGGSQYDGLEISNNLFGFDETATEIATSNSLTYINLGNISNTLITNNTMQGGTQGMSLGDQLAEVNVKGNEIYNFSSKGINSYNTTQVTGFNLSENRIYNIGTSPNYTDGTPIYNSTATYIPTITAIDLTKGLVSGTIPSALLSLVQTYTIELFATKTHEADTFLISIPLTISTSLVGSWTATISNLSSISTRFDSLTATATLNNNTSPLSAPFSLNPCNPFVVKDNSDNVTNPTCGTLRYAIIEANKTGNKTITFDVGSMPDKVISITSALPSLSMSGIEINGLQETDTVPSVEIKITNTSINNAIDVLFSASDCKIKGLAFNVNIGSNAINIGGANAEIAYNYLGMELNGSKGVTTRGTAISTANVGNGVHIHHNVIGNFNSGINSQRANAIIENNIIGFSPDLSLNFGLVDIGGYGIRTSNTLAINNLIKNNIIGNGKGKGIYILSANNVKVQKNYIGITPLLKLAPNSNGITISGAANVQIGNNTTDSSNFIAHNETGIFVEGSSTLTNSNTWNINAIYSNFENLPNTSVKGITLATGVQNSVLAPTNLALSADTTLSGEAALNSTVYIYADDSTQGKVYLGSAITKAGGKFSFKITSAINTKINGLKYLTALQESAGNSSEFSIPLKINLKSQCYGKVFTGADLTVTTSTGSGMTVAKNGQQVVISVPSNLSSGSEATLTLNTLVDMSTNKLMVIRLKTTDTAAVYIQVSDGTNTMTASKDGLIASTKDNFFEYRIDYTGFFGSNDSTKIKQIHILPVGDKIKSNTITIDSIFFQPVLNLNILGSQDICPGASVTLSSNVTETGITYKWDDLLSTSTIPTNTTPSVSISQTSLVRLTVQKGGCTASDIAFVNQTNILTEVSSSATTICTGDTALIRPNVLIGYDSIKWYDANSVELSTKDTLLVTKAGSYFFTKFKGTCKESSLPTTITEKTFTFSLGAKAVVPTVCGTDTILKPDSQQSTGSSYVWAWSKDKSTLGIGSQLTITEAAGYYLTITDGATACVSRDTISIGSFHTKADVSINPSTPQSICPGFSVALVGSQTTGATTQWFKNGLSLNVGTFSLIVTDPGMYSYIKTSANGCQDTSSQVTVNEIVVDNNFINKNSLSVCKADTTLDATYTWYFNTSPNPLTNLNITVGGKYIAQTTDANACTISDTVTIKLDTCSGSNTPPIALNIDVSTDEDTPIDIDITNFISDLDMGDVLGITTITNPKNGQANFAGLIITYTPNLNFNGVDNIVYYINDGNGGLDTAIITITINPVNDVPTLVGVLPSLTTNQDITVEVMTDIDILSLYSDVDITDALSIKNINSTSGNAGQMNNFITYLPNNGFSGSDIITFDICDNATPSACVQGSISVTVIAKGNNKPSAADTSITTIEDTEASLDLSSKISDPDPNDILTITISTNPLNGTISSVNGNVVTYLPNANYFGTDSYTYTVSDGKGGTATATVTVNVTAVNDAPVAPNIPSSFTVTQGTNSTNFILTGFTDAEKDEMMINSISSTLGNTVILSPSGLSFDYTPSQNGVDAITFEICDKVTPPACVTSTATINISPSSASCDKHTITKTTGNICDNTITLLASSEPGDLKTYTYQWFFGSSSNKIIGAVESSYKTLIEGDYFVLISDGATCDTTIKETAIYGIDKSTLQISGVKPMTAPSAKDYQWYVEMKDASLRAIAGATNKTYSPVFDATYSVLLGYENCKLMTNSFSLSGLGNGSVFRAGLYMTDTEIWIPEYTEPKLEVYPNPAEEGKFLISYTSFKDAEIQLSITNTSGISIYSKYIPKEGYETNLDMSSLNLESGIYFVQVSQDDNIVTQRVVVY